MQIEGKKCSAVLWKKLNVQSKLAKAIDKEPIENIRNQLVENYLQIFCKENARSVESVDKSTKQLLIIEELENQNKKLSKQQVLSGKKISSKTKSNQFRKKSKQLEQMEQSIVEKWKLGQDSQHNLPQQKTEQVTFDKNMRNKFATNLLKIKVDLHETKQNLSEFQAKIALQHQIIGKQIISSLSQKLQEFMQRYQQNNLRNQINYNQLLQQNKNLYSKNQVFKLQLLRKQSQIDKIQKQIKMIRIQNIELNQKVFDLQQKISQWDLQVQNKLKAHINFNTKNWAILFNKGEDRNELQKPMSTKQNAQKENEVLKANIQQKGSNETGKFNMKDLRIINFPNKTKLSLQNSLQEKCSLEGQQLIHFKNFKRNPSNNDESSLQYLEDRYRKKNYEDSFDFHHRVSTGALHQGTNRHYKNYYNNKSSLNSNQNSHLRKAQTPKVKANIFFKDGNEHDTSMLIGNTQKYSTPKQYIKMSKGFNVQNDIVANLLNKSQNEQHSKINKLGNKINDLREEIRKEINATMNM